MLQAKCSEQVLDIDDVDESSMQAGVGDLTYLFRR